MCKVINPKLGSHKTGFLPIAMDILQSLFSISKSQMHFIAWSLYGKATGHRGCPPQSSFSFPISTHLTIRQCYKYVFWHWALCCTLCCCTTTKQHALPCPHHVMYEQCVLSMPQNCKQGTFTMPTKEICQCNYTAIPMQANYASLCNHQESLVTTLSFGIEQKHAFIFCLILLGSEEAVLPLCSIDST